MCSPSVNPGRPDRPDGNGFRRRRTGRGRPLCCRRFFLDHLLHYCRKRRHNHSAAGADTGIFVKDVPVVQFVTEAKICRVNQVIHEIGILLFATWLHAAGTIPDQKTCSGNG